MFWYKKICFRPIEKQDLENVRKLRNDPTTWIYLSDVTQISPAMQEKWFESMEKASDKAYFAVFKQVKDFPISNSGDFLGIIRCDQLDHANRSIRVGADIIPTERGKGYGTLALQAILEFCFDHMGMHRVWLLTVEGNMVARRLYENVGFAEEGLYRESIWRNGDWNNMILMSILEDEYRKKYKK